MNKRKKIVVDHAKALFLEKGIQQTSIQDIIERSGISKGTFYNYFSSKDECISAILEQSYYEITISRLELLLKNNSRDLHILIQQICMFTRINEQQGISGLFEEIMHSGDKELKKVVMNYRLQEIEWLAGRFVEVFGDDLSPHALEAAVIYFGIQQNLNFAAKLTNQRSTTTEQIVKSVFHYMRLIINSLIHEGTAILDPERIVFFKSNFEHEQVRREEVLELLDEIIMHSQLTKVQLELAVGLKQELEKEELRYSIINALLSPFLDSFRGTRLYAEAKNIMGTTWLFISQQTKPNN